MIPPKQISNRMSDKLECYLCDIQTGLLTWTEGYGGVYLCEPCKVKTDNECSYCGATEELTECRVCHQPICDGCVKYEVEPYEYRFYCEQCYVHPPCTSCGKSFDDPENEMEECETCFKRHGDEFVAYINRKSVDELIELRTDYIKAVEAVERIQSLLRNEHSQDTLETACRSLTSIESVMNKE